MISIIQYSVLVFSPRKELDVHNIESSLNLIQGDLKCVIFVAVEMENQITTTNFFLSLAMPFHTFFFSLIHIGFRWMATFRTFSTYRRNILKIKLRKMKAKLIYILLKNDKMKLEPCSVKYLLFVNEKLNEFVDFFSGSDNY